MPDSGMDAHIAKALVANDIYSTYAEVLDEKHD